MTTPTDILKEQMLVSTKSWQHDRAKFLSASEYGQCIRRIYFNKHDYPLESLDPVGLFHRGDAVEHWVVEQFLAAQTDLLYAGQEQISLIYKNLSATPDGIFKRNDIVLEIKSIDPRTNPDNLPRPSHVLQAKQQMALFHQQTEHKPQKAYILYVDASDFERQFQFEVEYDPNFLEVALRRADTLFKAEHPMELPAEGRMDDACEYCPYQKACGEALVGFIPNNPINTSDEFNRNVEELADQVQSAKHQIKQLKLEQQEATEKLKHLMHNADLSSLTLTHYQIDLVHSDGRVILDKKQLAKDLGLDDLSDYETRGNPYDTLKIKET